MDERKLIKFLIAAGIISLLVNAYFTYVFAAEMEKLLGIPGLYSYA